MRSPVCLNRAGWQDRETVKALPYCPQTLVGAGRWRGGRGRPVCLGARRQGPCAVQSRLGRPLWQRWHKTMALSGPAERYPTAPFGARHWSGKEAEREKLGNVAAQQLRWQNHRLPSSIRRSAGGYLLQFANGAVVVAFAGQPGSHVPCGGAVAGIFGDPADGGLQRAGGCVLA